MRSSLPSLLPPAARKFSEVSAGLFVGARDYEDPALHQVPYAVDDAVDLAHLFALELQLIDPAKTVLLISGEPQKEESRDRLRALAAANVSQAQPSVRAVYDQAYRLGQMTEAEGLFVVSFAAHGFTDGGKGVLALSGALKRRPVLTGLHLDAVLDDLSQSRAQKRLVLVDACRERFEGKTRSQGDSLKLFGDAFLEAMTQARGCAILAGASRGGYAYDDQERQNGVFTAAVLDGLRGEAEGNADALVTVSSLAGFAQERVREWVLRNRPSHQQQSLGITPIYDPESIRDLPLAINCKAQRAAFEKQRNEALSCLIRHLGPKDETYLAVERKLDVDLPAAEQFELLAELAAFDGSRRSRHAILGFLAEANGFGSGAGEKSNLAPPEPAKPREIEKVARVAEKRGWESDEGREPRPASAQRFAPKVAGGESIKVPQPWLSREASDLEPGVIGLAAAQVGSEIDVLAAALEVSPEGLLIRLQELGLR
jgi:hypothetical protein